MTWSVRLKQAALDQEHSGQAGDRLGDRSQQKTTVAADRPGVVLGALPAKEPRLDRSAEPADRDRRAEDRRIGFLGPLVEQGVGRMQPLAIDGDLFRLGVGHGRG
ncbi:MAG TPA: hypothetical protein VMV69_14395 [Pirellulales bacterium]|nr:hypothetical protein [Pirellulales bacterium]